MHAITCRSSGEGTTARLALVDWAGRAGACVWASGELDGNEELARYAARLAFYGVGGECATPACRNGQDLALLTRQFQRVGGSKGCCLP